MQRTPTGANDTWAHRSDYTVLSSGPFVTTMDFASAITAARSTVSANLRP
jgi:hypothetical protein